MDRDTALIGIIVVLVITAIAFLYTYRPAHAPTIPAKQKATTSRSFITTATYHCDKGRTITATYYQGPQAPQPAPGQPPIPTGSVDVSLSDTPTTTLAQTLSADGSRYANSDESLVFWNKGDTALIMRNNTMDLNYTNCVAPK